MSDKPALFAIAVLLACALTGCGQKGPLYLPEAPTEVVTRPAATPPSSENTEAPNSPQSPDSAPAPPSPAPEVTAPEETPPADHPDDGKKDKKPAPPPPK
ncbi:MAG TPA: lipoprotein [Steroidobacteraceae bacterium]|jgi:predicted small lipoprotein YifL|nr:lipoprotein [Steroidobacteraceae bacterium]